MEVVPYSTYDRNLPKDLRRCLYRKSTGKSGMISSLMLIKDTGVCEVSPAVNMKNVWVSFLPGCGAV